MLQQVNLFKTTMNRAKKGFHIVEDGIIWDDSDKWWRKEKFFKRLVAGYHSLPDTGKLWLVCMPIGLLLTTLAVFLVVKWMGWK